MYRLIRALDDSLKSGSIWGLELSLPLHRAVSLKGSVLRNTGAWSELIMLPIVRDTAEEATEFEMRKKSSLDDSVCVSCVVLSPGCLYEEGQPDRAAVWREQLGGSSGTVLPSQFQVCPPLSEDCVCVGLCG